MNKKIMLTAIGAQAFLSFVYAQETVLQPLPTTSMPVSQTQTGDVDPNGGASGCLTLSTDLRYKMKDTVVGGDVSDLQDFFISVNLMQGESTGYFGAGTLKAVKLFQKKQGLNPTGFVGPLTRAKVNALSCSPLVPNLGEKPQIERPQRQMGEGAENDMQRGKGDASSTFPGMMNSFPPRRSDDSKKEQGHSQQDNEGQDQNKKRVSPPDTSMIMSYLSDTDKQTLKTKEDAMKSADEALKTYYLSVRSGAMSDDIKAKLSALESAAKQAHKDLEDTRKTIFDNLKSSLTTEQKQQIESTMKLMQPQGDRSGDTSDQSSTRKKEMEFRSKKMLQAPTNTTSTKEQDFYKSLGDDGSGTRPHPMPIYNGNNNVPTVAPSIIGDCSKGPC